MKLRFKILVPVVLTIVLILGVSTFLHIQAMRQDYFTAMEWRSTALAQDIVNRINTFTKYYSDQDYVRENIEGLLRSLSTKCIQLYELNKDKDVTHFSVINPEGVIAAHSDITLWATPVRSPSMRVQLARLENASFYDESVYHTLIPIFGPNNIHIGTINIGFSRESIDEKVRQILLRSAGLFALFLVFSSLAVAVLTREIVEKPLHRLVRFTRKISKGDFSDTFHKQEIERKDEIGALSIAFNNMALRLRELIAGLEKEITERGRTEEALKESEKELRTHRDQLEEKVAARTAELVLAKEQAEMANAAKGDFLARMSHEIRTPLNAVTGLTNIVLKSDLTDEQRDYLTKAQIAGANLLEVINDILDFSKVEAGRLELTHAPFELDRVMEDLAGLFSNRVTQKDLELIFAVAPQVPRRLIGDGGRLTQILTNLVENAVKFTEKGEIVVSVFLDEQDEKISGQTTIRFHVSDTGIGIDGDVLPSLFEPFTQAEGYLSREYEGTGLGLAICSRLVELMGGRIWAESISGRGSTFSFTVVLEALKSEEKVRFTLPEELHGLKTLIVDDSAMARQALVDLLESFTLKVSVAAGGEKAVEAVHRAPADEPYQLVLIDWKMDDMDGLEMASAIRNNTNAVNPHIIFMVTAYGLEQMKERIETAAVGSWLLKPINSSQLFNTIMDLFGQSEAMVSPVGMEREVYQSSLTGRRVLVVEDSALNREVAVALLEEAGLQVETAENGQLAVDMITGTQGGYYDGVFMDIQMPVMDGYEATRRIRALEADSQITYERLSNIRLPIIALTAHALTGEKEKCLDAGMDDYIAKPIDEEDLHRMLHKWILLQKGK